MASDYAGIDRRVTDRRETVDRRDMIRFELEKDPRRSGKDRRAQDIWQNRDKF